MRIALTNLLQLALLMASLQATAQIDLDNLYSYSTQNVPAYITEDNTDGNTITNAGATLGRVLFYDKNLSVNNTIACGSCHKQEFAFADTAIASVGVNGTTGRHSMRLVNPRFGELEAFFWDRRAASLEAQTTMPIQDHAEMGFSGTNGDPDIDSLIGKLQEIDYYSRLFELVYGDTVVTEQRMQLAMAQFIRSIQSFDSRYDAGLAVAPNANAPFPNFTQNENAGKTLFTAPPTVGPGGVRTAGGAGCAGCHRPPEFDIDPATLHNGVVDKIGGGTDLTNTRSPSLRDVFNANGELNTLLMHNGAFTTMEDVVDHYNTIVPVQGIDPRLMPGNNPQQLQLTAQEKANLVAFLKTLTGSNIYTDARWSDPFDNSGSLTVLPLIIDTTVNTAVAEVEVTPFRVYPTLVNDKLHIETADGMPITIKVFSLSGQLVYQGEVDRVMDVSTLQPGHYFIQAEDEVTRFVKL